MTSLSIIPESCLAVDLHSPILKRTQLEQPVELTGTIYFRLHDKSYFPPLPENSAHGQHLPLDGTQAKPHGTVSCSVHASKQPLFPGEAQPRQGHLKAPHVPASESQSGNTDHGGAHICQAPAPDGSHFQGGSHLDAMLKQLGFSGADSSPAQTNSFTEPDSLPKRTSHHPPEETQPSLPAMLATDRFSSGRVDRAASLSETDEQRRTHGMHPSASDLLADLNKRQSAAAASTDGFMPAPTTPPMTKVLHTLHAM